MKEFKIIQQQKFPFNVLPYPLHTKVHSVFPLVKAMLEVFFSKSI